MLEIKDLHVHYGGIHAVQGVNEVWYVVNPSKM